MGKSDLIYNWNRSTLDRRPLLNDETLRDGLQSPSVRDPDLEHKRDFLHRMARLGVDSIDLGFPGTSAESQTVVEALLREVRDQRLTIQPNVAGRTLESDLRPVAEIQQKVGIPLEVGAFLGSSPIRMDVEGWDIQHLVRLVREACRFARQNQIPLMMVTEDTTRSRPEDLRAIYRAALEEGAQAICLSDTCGHITPEGTRALVRFIREDVLEGRPMRLDWHGHNDRGLGLANAIAAFEAGADRLHGSILGIGERCGNVAMDQLMVNLTLMGCWSGDLTGLPELSRIVSNLCGFDMPPNYPMLGRDAFRTGTGVHASALIKALKRKDSLLADAVYSGVPAAMVGRVQEIEIGPVSGHSNVIYWLETHGWEPTDERVIRILAHARRSNTILTEEEIQSVL